MFAHGRKLGILNRAALGIFPSDNDHVACQVRNELWPTTSYSIKEGDEEGIPASLGLCTSLWCLLERRHGENYKAS